MSLVQTLKRSPFLRMANPLQSMNIWDGRDRAEAAVWDSHVTSRSRNACQPGHRPLFDVTAVVVFINAFIPSLISCRDSFQMKPFKRKHNAVCRVVPLIPVIEWFPPITESGGVSQQLAQGSSITSNV